MNPEWQARIESKLESHDKDFHSMASSLTGIERQMEKTNELLQAYALKDEKFNSRIEKLELNLEAKIESNHKAIERAHKRSDKVEAIFSRVAWFFILTVATGMIGAVIKFG